ncbi:MAG TPA: T9SS type A sorting domain-containing protein, partial [Ignavibacteria bacterium]|nr:T9SS type A sorting domain-containing protein [Ignavibacteria bacterium]
KSANVTLEVFDVTGKLIATLAKNEAVTAGLKEVEFNASSLPSGVYFYSLKSGDYSETKKMVLVK